MTTINAFVEQLDLFKNNTRIQKYVHEQHIKSAFEQEQFDKNTLEFSKALINSLILLNTEKFLKEQQSNDEFKNEISKIYTGTLADFFENSMNISSHDRQAHTIAKVESLRGELLAHNNQSQLCCWKFDVQGCVIL